MFNSIKNSVYNTVTGVAANLKGVLSVSPAKNHFYFLSRWKADSR